jgi:uncharacterized protein (DUF2147 family)
VFVRRPSLMRKLIAIFTLAALISPYLCVADTVTPVGLWQQIDDNTGKVLSFVRIIEQNGELRGTIEKLFVESGDDPTPRCTKCSDARRDQPIVGMVFLTGLKKNSDASLTWSGGEILDPDSGSIYRSKATLSEDGSRLHVRGYIGIAILGRTQTWKRVK